MAYFCEPIKVNILKESCGTIQENPKPLLELKNFKTGMLNE